MKHPRTCTTVLLAVSLATVLSGCSLGPIDLGGLVTTTSVADARSALRSSLSPAVSDADLVEAGTLTVGVTADETVPLAIAAADGTIEGINVDVAYALADELGLSSVKVVSVDGVAEGLEAGCDVVMGATAGDASDAVAVQGSYAQDAVALFGATAGGSAAGAAPVSASDLSGKTVGVQAGSVSSSTLSKLNLGITATTYSNLNDAFAALEAGEVDYVACDAYSGAYLASVSEKIAFAGTLDDASAVGMATSADKAALQAAVASAVEEISSNGVVGVARGRWVGSLPVLGEETKVSGLAEASDTTAGEDAASEDGTPAEADATAPATDTTSAE